jgi:hypothetical protein
VEEIMSEEYDGPERREGYAELAKRLDDHADEIAARFSRWFRAGLIAFAVIALTSAIALVGFGYALREIQQQRREICISQNRRHDNTINRLNNTDRFSPEGRKVTTELVDALVPVQNCSEIKSPLK